MITVDDILRSIETVAPPYMKMDWDNVGLLCGSRSQAVTKVLVALDPFEHVCQEAVRLGAELIVTHHPLIFQPIKAVTDETEPGRCIQILCRHGISAINAHTNLDCAPEGVNHRLASVLGLQDIRVIAPMGTDEEGRAWGLLRCGTVEPQPLNQFLATVKEALGCEGLRYTGSGPVHRVAVGGGACAGELHDAIAAGCDTFVTSDIKYNQFRDAQERGINLIDAGHFPTEDPITAVLVHHLRAAFPQLEIVRSQTHRDCIAYF